jgi:hypothetical protein
MINKQIIHTFLHIMAIQFQTSFLDAGFYPFLSEQGWPKVQQWFADLPLCFRSRSPRRPSLAHDTIISIPCFINGCHWAVVTRRVVAGKVTFLYSDDLNNATMESSICQTLSTSNATFYPPSSTWISCPTPVYHPHSNECGIRTLLALLIHALHPIPSASIIRSGMHANLPQIGRTWIALSIF